jgi:tRNA nucleotidyltransferase (CCA-adding enzyme)
MSREMKKYFRRLPREIRSLIALAKNVSDEIKMPAYLVGGFPRDLILGLKDWDLDITVEGNGIKFAENLARKSGAGLIRHERFGTATLILDHHLKVDIATTRKEIYPHHASLPVVSPGCLRGDLLRRDFTINAMAVSISDGVGQKLIDLFGGESDLASGKIRVLHDLSFKDDPTRILRAIRFKERYKFKIEPSTLRLLKEAIKDGLLEKVNPHRMRDELVLMFKEKDPSAQLRQLYALGGLYFISNKLKPNKRTYDLFKSVNQEVSWFMRNIPLHKQFDVWLIYLAALLKQLSLSQVRRIIRSLGLSKQEENKIVSCCKINQKLIARLKNRQIKPAQVFALLEPLSYEAIILLRSISQDSVFKKHIADFLKVYNVVRLSISGDDLYDLGVLPGPRYQKILSMVMTAKLNGKAGNRQQELDLVRKIIR